MKNKSQNKTFRNIKSRNSLNLPKSIDTRNKKFEISESKSEIPIKKELIKKSTTYKSSRNSIQHPLKSPSLKIISSPEKKKSENNLKKKESNNEKIEQISKKNSLKPLSEENIENKNEIVEETIKYVPEKPDKERNKNIRVYVRFRPFNIVETELLNSGVGFETPEYEENEIVKIKNFKSDNNNNNNNYPMFKFDKVFKSETPQNDIYEIVGKEIVKDVMDGYNGTIFAYGQSGSGKTYTMYGKDIDDDEHKGLIPRIVEEIFNYVDNSDQNISYQFKLSVLQIYKEVIYDLLTGEKNLQIKESPTRGIYVDNLSEVYLSSLEDFLNYADEAESNRKVGETRLNQTSSRSHSIMILEVTQSLKKENLIKKGILNLVDLAGSEKVSKTGAVGETLEEAKKINLSLSALGNVIHALTSNQEHIPYRDSKLTRILQESLGGNYKTSLIVACSPHSYNVEETISSLQFAQRAKTIKNKVKVNIKYSYEELQKMVFQLKKKLENANQKIMKLMKGENVDDNTIDENGNNNYCGKCSLLKEEKKVLKEKIEELLNEIKEKNSEIQDLKDKDSSFSEDSEEVKDKIVSLYKKIKEELENIKERNTNFEIDKIQENIVLQNENLNEILQKYNKEFNKNNLFEEMNLMMKKSLDIKKEEKYESIYNNYKKNLDKIFKEQLDNKAIKNISDKEQLNLFSMNYFYDYLQYYFSYQLINNGYEKLKIDNKSLMNMTKTLLSIVDDILSSNYEMVTTNNIHVNALNFIKTNLIDKQKMNSNLNPINVNNDQMPIIRSQKKELSIKFGNNLNQGVIKVVNKNNLNIMKQNRRRGSIIITETQGENLNDNKINNTENNNIENDNNNNNNINNNINNNNININNNINNNINLNFKRRTSISIPIIPKYNTGNSGKNTLNNDNVLSSFISHNSNSSDKNQKMFLKTEKKQSKLTLLKDLLVANVKKSEGLRKEIYEIRDDCNKIIQFNKEYFTNLILKNEIPDVEKLENEIEIKKEIKDNENNKETNLKSKKSEENYKENNKENNIENNKENNIEKNEENIRENNKENNDINNKNEYIKKNLNPEITKIPLNKIENISYNDNQVKRSIISVRSEDKDKTKSSFERELKRENIESRNLNFDLALNTLKNIKNNEKKNEYEKIEYINQTYNQFLKSSKNEKLKKGNLSYQKRENNKLKLVNYKTSNSNFKINEKINNSSSFFDEEDENNSTPTNRKIKSKLIKQKEMKNNSRSLSSEIETTNKKTLKKKEIKIEIEDANNNSNNNEYEKNNKLKDNLILKTIQSKSCRSKYKNKFGFLNQENSEFEGRRFETIYDSNSIESCIEKYLETGTVTRKFDGIKVNIINGKVNCEYEVGLNASNKMTGNPLFNQRLKASKGDDDSVNESSSILRSTN